MKFVCPIGGKTESVDISQEGTVSDVTKGETRDFNDVKTGSVCDEKADKGDVPDKLSENAGDLTDSEDINENKSKSSDSAGVPDEGTGPIGTMGEITDSQDVTEKETLSIGAIEKNINIEDIPKVYQATNGALTDSANVCDDRSEYDDANKESRETLVANDEKTGSAGPIDECTDSADVNQKRIESDAGDKILEDQTKLVGKAIFLNNLV